MIGCRWFKTGDIGAIDTDHGRLRIVDRKKDLVKLRHGEYVALSKVEGVLRSAPEIEQVMCVGKSSMATLCAVVVPSKHHMASSGAAGGSAEDEEALCKSQAYRDTVAGIIKVRLLDLVTRNSMRNTRTRRLHLSLVTSKPKLEPRTPKPNPETEPEIDLHA